MAQAVNGSGTGRADGGAPHAQDAPDLETLRRRVRALECGEADARAPVLPLGARAIDELLPGGGLARAGVHELLPERTAWDDGPAAGFALALPERHDALEHGHHPALVMLDARQDVPKARMDNAKQQI